MLPYFCKIQSIFNFSLLLLHCKEDSYKEVWHKPVCPPTHHIHYSLGVIVLVGTQSTQTHAHVHSPTITASDFTQWIQICNCFCLKLPCNQTPGRTVCGIGTQITTVAEFDCSQQAWPSRALPLSWCFYIQNPECQNSFVKTTKLCLVPIQPVSIMHISVIFMWTITVLSNMQIIKQFLRYMMDFMKSSLNEWLCSER